MGVRLGPLRIPWGKKPSDKDPYWDYFLNARPYDPGNALPEIVRQAKEGNIFPTKAELHTPEINSTHVKVFARYLGAKLVGIVSLDSKSAEPADYRFAVVAVVEAEQDPATSPGIGGQVPVQNGQFVSFILSAYIRELGYRATARNDADPVALAAAAGLGTVDADGKLVTREYGRKVHVADAVLTDIPLAPGA